jgi:hypothetical protein
MQVEVDSLQSGETARMSFELPHSYIKIDLLGTVVWDKNGRQGIQFTKVVPKVQDEIKAFVDRIESSLK